MIEFPYDSVEGLISFEDTQDLARMSAMCSLVEGQYVEIGSMHGLSTLCILSQMPSMKTLFAFDPNHKTNRIQENLELANCRARVVLVSSRLEDSFCVLPQHIALAFVDHDHRLSSTKFAYNAIWPRLSVGGIIAFHDYLHGDYPEPSLFLELLAHARIIKRPGMIAFIK